jgi:uncharacterized protein with NAD-binding domain and iron-sulfur cluster
MDSPWNPRSGGLLLSNAPGDSDQPVRVAVVGGGCAALTAAFELTKPEHMGRYQVTVYQMGWRLGGKGASGRGAADRIEEHGLHLWMGFYENAFRLMRECYEERQAAFPDCRFSDWRDAFKPAPDVGVADRTREGWSFWLAHFPPGQGEPGDPTDKGPFTVLAYLRQSAMLIGELLRSAATMECATGGGPRAPEQQRRFAAEGPDALASAINRLLRYGQLATTAVMCEGAEILSDTFERFFPQMFRDGALLPIQLLNALTATARRQIERLVASDGELRAVWQVIDLILAILRGAVRSGLALDPQGFDALNDYDWREWLRLNGASEQSLDSGFMRGIYDLAFAFEDGDTRRPRLAAGVALRGAMRMFFTYRGALFWRMSAGMGDVVFAPLYQVLRQRGVRFKFFHRLRNVGLSPRGNNEPAYVQTLEFDVQARVKGASEYQPLVDIRKVPSWPALPDYGQLVNGRALARQGRAFEAVWERRRAGTKTLQVTRDFDFAVLGVSIGAIPDVARELIEREQGWRDMVRHVRTVPTQAFQIWMRKDVRELGWMHPPVNLSGFVEPFDTWADMSHLIPEESWNDHVKAIAYFCSVLPDPLPKGGAVTEQFQQTQHDAVRANAVRFLNKDAGWLWPRATSPAGGFDWEVLASCGPGDGKGHAGERRFKMQFWTANINPTDRYVQSLPGSIIYRISPLDMTFDNLTIAGDWTATGLDTGCIESAVMSGRLAAHAISQRPRLQDIVGYDHP